MGNPESLGASVVEPLALGAREAARALGVSERTVWALVKRGQIPSAMVGGRRLFPVASLRDWLKARETKSRGAEALP